VVAALVFFVALLDWREVVGTEVPLASKEGVIAVGFERLGDGNFLKGEF